MERQNPISRNALIETPEENFAAFQITTPESVVPVWLTKNQAKTKYKLSYQFISALCDNNTIVHIKVGTKTLINEQKFVEFLNTVGRRSNTEQGVEMRSVEKC